MEFEIKEKDRNGAVVSIKYSGCFLIVDNGYIKWSTTVPPTKNPVTEQEFRWSEWLESLRKDVKCTFGILKGRWQILKSGTQIYGIAGPDKVWLTCCAFHNMLLDVDGLDQQWVNGVPSDWEGPLGQLNGSEAPFAIQRLNSAIATLQRILHTSAMGPGNDGGWWKNS